MHFSHKARVTTEFKSSNTDYKLNVLYQLLFYLPQMKWSKAYLAFWPCLVTDAVFYYLDISDCVLLSPSTVNGEAPVNNSYVSTPRDHQSTA